MRATRKGNTVTYHYRGNIIDNLNKTEDDIEKCYEELDRLEREFEVIDKIHKDYKSRITKKKNRISDLKSFMRLLLKDYLGENKEGDNE